MIRKFCQSLALVGALFFSSHAAQADVLIPTVQHQTPEFLSSSWTFYTDANMYVLGNINQPWYVGRGTTVSVPMGGGYTFVNTTVISYDNRTLYEIPAGTYMKVPYFAEEPSQPDYQDDDQGNDQECHHYYYHNGNYYCRDDKDDHDDKDHHDDEDDKDDGPSYAYASSSASAGKGGVSASSTAIVVGSGSASARASASSGSSSVVSWATAGGKKN
jgi:hypothetical protein